MIVIPLAGAMLVFACRGRAGLWVSLGTAGGTLAAGLVLAGRLWREGTQIYYLGGWELPLGIHWRADGLSGILILMTGVVGTVISFYAASYFATGKKERGGLFWPLWFLLWAALNAVYVSADIFNIYVALELVGISAVALTAISGETKALVAAFRYLVAAMVGSLSYLMGVVFLYGTYGTLDLYELGAGLEPGIVAGAAAGLMVLGLVLKTALFPLHFWLPPAHSSAPPPVSAILSALVVKVSFYLVVRLWFDLFGGTVTYAAGQMAGALGAAAILWGSVQAMRQRRLKLMVAYSTVGQVGYLFLLFPLMTVTQPEGVATPWMVQAWTGVMYQAVVHAFAKSAMFLSAGVIFYAVGSDHIREMRDIAGRLPVTAFTLALAGVSLIGLPPSGGFIAKWLVLKAVIESGQWWWGPVVVIGGLLTAGYVFMILQYFFIPAERDLPLRRPPRVMELSALALALISIVIGFRVQEPLRFLETGTSFTVDPVEEVIGL